MYKIEYILESIDSFIEIIKNKFTLEELEQIHSIRDNISQSKSDEEVEKWFFDLGGGVVVWREGGGGRPGT